MFRILVPLCRCWGGHGFDSQWVLRFFNWPNPSSRIMALGSTQPLTEISTRNLTGDKGRPAPNADNLTAVSRLSRKWASTSCKPMGSTFCYRDSFTFFMEILMICGYMLVVLMGTCRPTWMVYSFGVFLFAVLWGRGVCLWRCVRCLVEVWLRCFWCDVSHYVVMRCCDRWTYLHIRNYETLALCRPE
jgi:hypothetical protein